MLGIEIVGRAAQVRIENDRANVNRQKSGAALKVLIFGATGMLGQSALRECLLDPDVESVVTIGRTATGAQNPKMREIAQALLAVAKHGYEQRVLETRDIRAVFGRWT